MAPNPPRFVVLDYPIPADNISDVLCRFVVDYSSPLARSAPAKLPAFTKDYTYDCGSDTNVSVLLQSSTNEIIRGKLDQVFSLAFSRDTTRRRELSSECIKTYRIRDHDKLFDQMGSLPEFKKEVEALFYRPGQRVSQIYMVVGVKTVQDATSKTEKGGSSSNETKAALPVGAAVATAGVAADPRSTVGAEWQQSLASSTVYEAKHQGEQIFAVEYRVVKQRLLAKWRGGDVMALGRIKSYGWGEGTMAGDSDSEEDDDDDDQEEVEEEEIERLPQLRVSKLGKCGLATIE
ncbi:hypothetical protein BKA63DRAFT_600249 [Paraphoma chrysanthemicola]|nr:hypothetical protein BKA63DRAFT_600249 [Paraphoma chrysanthemicola]